MKLELLPGTGGVVRFPAERRAKPTLALAEELAPRSDLTDTMADEWANGEDRLDTLAQAVQAFTMLAEALEFSMGVDAALAHLRAMNEVQVQRACALGWAYRDAEAAAEGGRGTVEGRQAGGVRRAAGPPARGGAAQPRVVDGGGAGRAGGDGRGARRQGGA